MSGPQQVVNNNAPRSDSWHFEKRLSLDTLAQIAGIAIVLGGPLLYWGYATDGRIKTLELHDLQREKQDIARDMDARDQRIALLGKIEKLDDQVTQLRIDVGRLLPPKGRQ